MKCEFCAGDLSINDVRCPHCDAENPYYAAHRQDMKRFENDYASIKNEVSNKTTKYTKKALYITIISVLLLLNIVGILLCVNAREISYEIKMNKNKQNSQKYADIAESLSKDGEFLALNSLLNQKSYYGRGGMDLPLNDFSGVQTVAIYYKTIFSYVAEIVYGKSYSTDTEIASRINTSLGYIYEQRYEYAVSRKDTKYYSDKNVAIMDEIIKEINVLLNSYLGIDMETLENFNELTPANRQLILEEAVMEVMNDEE